MPHQNSSGYVAAILNSTISVREESGKRKGRKKKKDFVTWTILYSICFSPEVGSKGVKLSEIPPWHKAKYLGIWT